MSKHKDINFDYAQKFVTDKGMAIRAFVNYHLDKLQQMFTYDNLPDSIPQQELERLLQTKGQCFITSVDDTLYALSGGFSGENDVYEHPRFYTATNTALNLSKTYEIGIDGVLAKNDYNMVSLMPLLLKYGSMMVEADISLNTTTILSRIMMLISAPDDKTKASADLFLSKIINGDFSIIGENGFFDGVKLQTTNQMGNKYLTQYIELIQYYKGSFLNEIGLNANYNMKRERLTDDEVSLNIDAIFPFIDNMYESRCLFVDEVNEMFGTEIVVNYNSVWKTNHEELERDTDIAMLEVGENGTTNSTLNLDSNTGDTITNSDLGNEADTQIVELLESLIEDENDTTDTNTDKEDKENEEN